MPNQQAHAVMEKLDEAGIPFDVWNIEETLERGFSGPFQIEVSQSDKDQYLAILRILNII